MVEDVRGKKRAGGGGSVRREDVVGKELFDGGCWISGLVG